MKPLTTVILCSIMILMDFHIVFGFKNDDKVNQKI